MAPLIGIALCVYFERKFYRQSNIGDMNKT